MGAIFTYLFFNADEVSGLKLKTATVKGYNQVAELLKINVIKVAAEGKIGSFVDNHKAGDGFMHLYGNSLIRRMLKDGNSVDEVVAQILLTSTGTANLSPQVCSLVEAYIVCSDSGSVFVG